MITVQTRIKSTYEDISKLITQTKMRVQQNLNSEMVVLYWNVGKKIRLDILGNEKAEYGKEVIANLSLQLSKE